MTRTRSALILQGGLIVTGMWAAYNEEVAAAALTSSKLDHWDAIVLTDVEIRGPQQGVVHTGHMVIRKSAILAVSVVESSDLVTPEMLSWSMPGIVPGE